MSQREWDRVTKTERAFMINALEIDIPPGVLGDLEQSLADPTSWEYPDDPSWVGRVTLVETDAGRAISRRTPQEMAGGW